MRDGSCVAFKPLDLRFEGEKPAIGELVVAAVPAIHYFLASFGDEALLAEAVEHGVEGSDAQGDAAKFNEDLLCQAATTAVSGVTLSHNVGSPAEVDGTVDALVAAGATVLKHPQPGAFGGIYHAHISDPNGLVWEIAHNPGWSIDADGAVSFY